MRTISYISLVLFTTFTFTSSFAQEVSDKPLTNYEKSELTEKVINSDSQLE